MSDNNTFACADHFFDKKIISHFYFAPSIFCNLIANQLGMGGNICEKVFGVRKVYELYISCMYFLVFQRKPCLSFMNRLNSLKHMQNFDVYNYNQKKKKKRKGKNKIKHSVYNVFCNTGNITTSFELSQGKFMGIEYGCN